MVVPNQNGPQNLQLSVVLCGRTLNLLVQSCCVKGGGRVMLGFRYMFPAVLPEPSQGNHIQDAGNTILQAGSQRAQRTLSGRAQIPRQNFKGPDASQNRATAQDALVNASHASVIAASIPSHSPKCCTLASRISSPLVHQCSLLAPSWEGPCEGAQ